MIPTWRERLHPYQLIIVGDVQFNAMQSEIDDYKAALAAAGTVTGNMMREYAEMRDKLATIENETIERCAKVCDMAVKEIAGHRTTRSWQATEAHIQCGAINSCATAIRALK